MKSESKKASRGRPTKYKPDYCRQAYQLALLGATDTEIAAFFEVNEDTIHEWKKKHPEFSESLQGGKIKADAEVAAALYKKATGFTIQEKTYEQSRLSKIVKKEIPPDTGAITLWLRNRQGLRWKEKVEINWDQVPEHILDQIINKLRENAA